MPTGRIELTLLIQIAFGIAVYFGSRGLYRVWKPLPVFTAWLICLWFTGAIVIFLWGIVLATALVTSLFAAGLLCWMNEDESFGIHYWYWFPLQIVALEFAVYNLTFTYNTTGYNSKYDLLVGCVGFFSPFIGLTFNLIFRYFQRRNRVFA